MKRFWLVNSGLDDDPSVCFDDEQKAIACLKWMRSIGHVNAVMWRA